MFIFARYGRGSKGTCCGWGLLQAAETLKTMIVPSTETPINREPKPRPHRRKPCQRLRPQRLQSVCHARPSRHFVKSNHLSAKPREINTKNQIHSSLWCHFIVFKALMMSTDLFIGDGNKASGQHQPPFPITNTMSINFQMQIQRADGYEHELPTLPRRGSQGPHPPSLGSESICQCQDACSAEEGLVQRQRSIREIDEAHTVPCLLSEPNWSTQTKRGQSPAVPQGTEGTGLGHRVLATPSCERPKVVFSKRKRKMLHVAAIFHLPAVALTLILLGFYITHTSWPSPGPTNNALNSIQFAAKIHEALAFGSITQIVFHRLRYELLGERGLPFGLVVAAFQITSIPYFFSKQFWSPMKALRQSPHQILTCILLLASLVLVMALGPSSAIVMMPRLGWSRVPITALNSSGDRGGQQVTRDAFMGSKYSDIYPLNITVDNGRLDVCAEWYAATGDYPAECPSGGCRDLIASLTAMFLTHNETTAGAQASFNMTVSALVGSRIVTGDGLSWSNISQENTIAYATTPSDFLVSALNWKSPQIQNSKLPPPYRIEPGPPKVRGYQAASWLQPLVVVQCAPNATDIFSDDIFWYLRLKPDVLSFSFPKGAHESINISLSGGFLKETFGWASFEYPPTKTRLAGFVNIDHQLGFPGSVAMVLPEIRQNVLTGVDLCIAEPSWIDSDIKLVQNATASPVPWSGISIDLEGMIHGHSANDRPLIRLEPDWIDSLNQNVPMIQPQLQTEETEGVPLFDYIASFCSVATSTQKCQAIFLASFLADAISRSHHVHPSVYLSSNGNGSGNGYEIMHSTAYNQAFKTTVIDTLEEVDLLDADLYTNIPFVTSNYAYGYRLNNLTVVLAMAVLLLHVALVLVHLLIGLLGSSWSSMAWSELGELLALGIQSDRTPLLENSGAGVSRPSIWRLKAFVREHESGTRLQLVLCEQPHNDKRHQLCAGASMGILPKADQEYG